MGHRARRFAILFVVLGVVSGGVLIPKSVGSPSVTLVAAGDFSSSTQASAVLASMGAETPNAALALGDLSYSTAGEDVWCDFVKSRVGDGFPFQLVAGNHESNGQHGHINNYSACLPNQVPGVVGTYGRQYYFDLPSPTSPLVRVIMVSPNQTFPDGWWDSREGTTRYEWLEAAIDSARAAGARYVVVGAHFPCLGVGESYRSSCPMQEDVLELLVEKRVDLVLSGHEHNYQRTHQLATGPGCATINTTATDADCIIDDDGDFVAGAGTVFATVGTGGMPLTDIVESDAKFGYFAAASGADRNPTWGSLRFTVSDAGLDASFVAATGGSFSDSFRIGPPLAAAPDEPANVTAQSSGSTTMQVAWSPSPGATSYRVLRCSAPSCSPDAEIWSGSATSFEDSELQPATTYGYAVVARNAFGDSAASQTAFGTTAQSQSAPPVLVAEESQWRWRYSDAALPADWTSGSFDDSLWREGRAPLGFGHSWIATDITTAPGLPDPRPRSLQLRHTFTVDSPSAYESLTLITQADDGVVVYLNGTEIARGNMPAGDVSIATYPTAAPGTPVPVEVSVPVSLLRAGTNEVAAFTNLNYRKTRNVSFEASLLGVVR